MPAVWQRVAPSFLLEVRITPEIYPTGAAASFAGDASFGASNGTNSLTVYKAKLIVSADSKTRPYGALNPPLTASYTGFVNGRDFSPPAE